MGEKRNNQGSQGNWILFIGVVLVIWSVTYVFVNHDMTDLLAALPFIIGVMLVAWQLMN
ncbi:MAG: hypothetical protein LBR25_04130 [Erysipelotrichaceae bacterium]|jgi:hypothetical protein|nr:hypothetical protein [Erysipelotrichaceae bacterium]